MSSSKRSVFVAAAALSAAGFALVSASHGQEAAKPAAFYSEAQSERGAKLYEEKCATCHGADLAGAPGAPGLSGAEFSFGWKDKSVADLYDFIHTNMPPGEAGGMSETEYADIVALVLKTNKYPAGEADLKPDVEAMKAMPLAKP
jgi:cytochrome c